MATAFLDRVVNKAIGELLIEKGTVTPEQVSEALAFSRDQGIRLGEALLGLGYVTQEALNYALGEQYGVRPMELHPNMLDERLIRRFPLELLQRHLMIPLIDMGGEIVVVVSDPNQSAGLEELKALVPGSTVSPQLADEDQIRRCLDVLSHGARRSGGVQAQSFGGGPIDVQVHEQPPEATDPAFVQWLLTTCLHSPHVDLLMRPIGRECQVAWATSPLEEVHRFAADAFPVVRDALWKNCIAEDHTRGNVGHWQAPLRYAGHLFELLVISSGGARSQTLRLRALTHPARGSAPTRVPAAFPRIQPGACTVVLYDDLQDLEAYLGELLVQIAAGQVTLLAQQTTRQSWEGVTALPLAHADIAQAAGIEGATLVLYDSPVPVAEVLRLVRGSFAPPAVVVCAPVITSATGGFGISPDIDEIRTRLAPELITLRAGAASHSNAGSATDGGEA